MNRETNQEPFNNNDYKKEGEKREENNFGSAWEKPQEQEQNNLFSEAIYSDEDENDNLYGQGDDNGDSVSLEKGGNKRWIFALIFVVIVVSFFLFNSQEEEPLVNKNETEEKTINEIKTKVTGSGDTKTAGVYSLKIVEQEAGDKINIAAASFPEDSWVVIYSDDNNQPKNIISAYRFSQGEVSDWKMPLITNLEPATQYHAVIHGEDGDRLFDYNKDIQLFDEDGNLLYASFKTK